MVLLMIAPQSEILRLFGIQKSVNCNRSLVSEDLQQLILATNPDLVKFTASQRLNTQLVLDEYVLKKKKGQNFRQVRVLSQGTSLNCFGDKYS